jgi:hypothetical protein
MSDYSNIGKYDPVNKQIPLNLKGISPHFMNDKSSLLVPQRHTTREHSFTRIEDEIKKQKLFVVSNFK